jgi:hypothetical protein
LRALGHDMEASRLFRRYLTTNPRTLYLLFNSRPSVAEHRRGS